MRIGGPVFVDTKDPEALAAAHLAAGYTAAFCPEHLRAAQHDDIESVKRAYAKANIIIAEVFAMANMMSPVPGEAKKNRTYVAERLQLAEELGAVCCIDIIGTHNTQHWYSHHPDNYSENFFAEAVDAAREIIDAVKPTHTRMCFELMPFNFLDSAEEILRFIKAVDRPALGAHLDAVNCITSPRHYFRNGIMAREMVKTLAPYLVSVHCKDILLRDGPGSVMFEEVPLGTGNMDYVALCRALGSLSRDLPCMLEALPEEAYPAAQKALRKSAKAAGADVVCVCSDYSQK